MNIPFSPILQLTWLAVGVGAVQTGIGVVGKISAKAQQKKLLGQEKPYKTPQEVYDVLHATQANASEGLDPSTLSYLNNQTDQAFSGSIDAATKLGANPNDLSAIFGQKIDAIMKIGAENHAANTANFSQYISALDTVSANKAAEQKSQQDIVKNKLQATAENLATSSANISGGLNTAISGYSAYKTGQLYNPDGSLKTPNNPNGLATNTVDVGNIGGMGNLAPGLSGGSLATG